MESPYRNNYNELGIEMAEEKIESLSVEEVEKWAAARAQITAAIPAMSVSMEDRAIFTIRELHEKQGGMVRIINAQEDALGEAEETIHKLQAENKRLAEAFNVPELTGIWHYHRKGIPSMWCATYVDKDGICDTAEFDSPWKALEAALAETKKGE